MKWKVNIPDVSPVRRFLQGLAAGRGTTDNGSCLLLHVYFGIYYSVLPSFGNICGSSLLDVFRGRVSSMPASISGKARSPALFHAYAYSVEPLLSCQCVLLPAVLALALLALPVADLMAHDGCRRDPCTRPYTRSLGSQSSFPSVLPLPKPCFIRLLLFSSYLFCSAVFRRTQIAIGANSSLCHESPPRSHSDMRRHTLLYLCSTLAHTSYLVLPARNSPPSSLYLYSCSQLKRSNCLAPDIVACRSFLSLCHVVVLFPYLAPWSFSSFHSFS